MNEMKLLVEFEQSRSNKNLLTESQLVNQLTLYKPVCSHVGEMPVLDGKTMLAKPFMSLETFLCSFFF